MAKKSESCEIPQAPKGGNSKLYLGLKGLCGGDNLLANYVYALYRSSNVAERMGEARDSSGRPLYEEDSQGEHSPYDVYHFLNIREIADKSVQLFTLRQSVGSVDRDGNLINYRNAEEALQRCARINQANPGRVAYVVNAGGGNFNIYVEEKDSRTQIKTLDVDEQISQWETLREELGKQGVDLDALAYTNSVANPLQVNEFVEYMRALSATRNDVMTLSDIKILLNLCQNDPSSRVRTLIQNAISKYGSIEEAAQKVYDILHATRAVAGKAFATNLLDQMKTSETITGFEGLLTTVSNELAEKSISFRAGRQEEEVQEVLNALYEKHKNLDKKYRDVTQGINSLSDAIAQAAMTLQRQMRYLLKQEGRTEQGKRIEETLSMLMNELERKQYTRGIATFLSDAVGYAQTISDSIKNLPSEGTTMDVIRERAKVCMQANTMKNGYYEIVCALANIHNLTIDENISEEDKANIQTLARQLRDLIEANDNSINGNIKVTTQSKQGIAEKVVTDVATYIIGNQDYNGLPISTLVTMAKIDSSIMDYLYAPSRVSNPLMAAMNTVVRDAQGERDTRLRKYGLEIDRITARYREKSGSRDTSFMYQKINDDEGGGLAYRIVTKEGVDWAAYEKARFKAKKQFEKRGLKNFALKDAMEQWEQNNNIMVPVDRASGREEQIPNGSYRLAVNPYDSFTEAQKEYYDAVMKIKGELGSLMPIYAQDMYRPIYISGNILEIIVDGVKHKHGAKAIATAVLSKLNKMKIQSDDNFYSKNGQIMLIDGEQYAVTESDYNNHMLRQIPIYYYNQLDNQAKLLMDFSSALRHLAGTAVNYDTISKVKDIVEVMGAYISEQGVIDKKNGIPTADEVAGEYAVGVISPIYKRSKRNEALVDGFISKLIYNQSLKNENMKLAPLVKALIAFTSFKALTINLKGAIANELVGEYNMLIKAIGGTFTGVDYNLLDYAEARAILFGRDGIWDAPQEIMDILTNNVNSKGKLLEQRFNPLVDEFDEQTRKRYSTGFRALMGGFNSQGLYAAGEYLIHYTNMYAILVHQQVYKDGKKISLYKALQPDNKKDGSSELVYDGVTLDEEGTKPLTEEYLDYIRDKIRLANQQCHGSMSDEDKGLIHSRLSGKLVMNFRQWMVEHYSRRYRTRHFDGTMRHGSIDEKWQEGMYITAAKFLYNFGKQMLKLDFDTRMRWRNMSDVSRSNVIQAFSEMTIKIALFMAVMAIGPVKGVGAGDDRWHKWWKRMWLYQLNRLKMEVSASTPLGAIWESKAMLNAPVPSVNTVNGLMYPIMGLLMGHQFDTLKSGPYKGQNKYWRNIKKYTIPFWYQAEQLSRLDEDENAFFIFQLERRYM